MYYKFNKITVAFDFVIQSLITHPCKDHIMQEDGSA